MVVEPEFLVHVEPTSDLVQEYFERNGLIFERRDDRVVAAWKDYVITARVVERGIMLFSARLKRSFDSHGYLGVIELCNEWNARRVGPKASASLGAAEARSSADTEAPTTGAVPYVSLAVELEVPFSAGLNRLQLHVLFEWFHVGVRGFRDQVTRAFPAPTG